MKLLVIGAGQMGSAAAYDMAQSPEVKHVTLADSDYRRAKDAASRINKLARSKKVEADEIDAGSEKAARKLMRDHDAALSAVPYFYNLGLAKAAIDAGCHFADLGGNNRVVRAELDLSRKAEKAEVAIAPDCGLSPGMASVLAGELMRRIGGRADSLKIYVGGLPVKPKPPFNYQMVFSVEGLINEYVEPAKILRHGKITTIEPLTEIESFKLDGLPTLEAFHTSGGTSTLPETFEDQVGECFEKTLRFPGHCAMIRGLYDLGMFSSERRRINGVQISPREVTAKLLEEKLSGDGQDMTVLRVEADSPGPGALRRLLGKRPEPQRRMSFTLIDRYDPETDMTSMMRTTAWPASIVLQMLASGVISKRGAVLQERDVPAKEFLETMARRGIEIRYESKLAS